MKHFKLLSYFLFSNTLFFSQNSEQKSISFIKHLEKQQFDSCYVMFDTVISNKISVDMLQQMWQSLPRFMGDYKAYSSVTTEKKDSTESVFIRCDFEKTKLDLQLVYSTTSNKIIGIFFAPPKNKTTYVLPEYAQQHKYYESKLDLKTEKLTLPGMLCVPNNIKNPPVVILLAGSGPNDKDETIGPNKILKDLAIGFACNGIASFRYDKRNLTYGSVMSKTPDELSINTEVIQDALSAVKLIKANSDFKKSKVYIVGHSLGAMCAPFIASKSKAINGIVLLAGNARPLEDLILEQYNYIFGLDSIDINEKKEIETLTEQIKTVKTPSLLKIAKAENLPLELPSNYWQSLTKYNQVEVAKKIKQPILIIQGERDYQVTMTDFNIWKQQLINYQKNKFITYPNLNHILMDGKEKSTPSEYEKQGNVAEQLIIDISKWIKSN